MLKYISICAVLVALGTGALNAQQGQQEATLQKVKVPGAGFDIVLAMPKSQTGATFDLGNSPDATIVYLIGGELALSFDGPEKMLQALDSLQLPVCAFHVDSKDSKASKPVAVYTVPNGETPVAQQQDVALQGQTLTMSLIKMEPPGAEFDIVFGLTKSPGSGKLVFKYDDEADEMFPAIVPMLIPSCITHVERNAGTADVIAVYVVPKKGRLGPPMQ